MQASWSPDQQFSVTWPESNLLLKNLGAVKLPEVTCPDSCQGAVKAEGTICLPGLDS